MGTTPTYQIPYVEPSDTLAAFPAADKAQAERIEAIIGAPPSAPPFGAMSRTTTLSVAASTEVKMTWNQTDFAPRGIAQANGDWTIQSAGIYLIKAGVMWGPDTGGMRQLRLKKNGTTTMEVDQTPSSAASSVSQLISFVHKCTVGDVFWVGIYSTVATTTLAGNAANNVSFYRLSAT